jgi:phosphinothricin acetyltransferase
MNDLAQTLDHVVVRDASAADLARVQAIYAHHVDHGLGTFEERAPNLAEITERFEHCCRLELPYLVADNSQGVQGFAYAARFRPRSAYRYTVEDSIYVAPEAQRQRIGHLLLEALIERCTALGYRQMIAVIGDSGNTGSIALHRKAGFRRTGQMDSVGFKFGRWVDCVIMQRELGPGDSDLPAGG